jgi:hypothetical protein
VVLSGDQVVKINPFLVREDTRFLNLFRAPVTVAAMCARRGAAVPTPLHHFGQSDETPVSAGWGR